MKTKLERLEEAVMFILNDMIAQKTLELDGDMPTLTVEQQRDRAVELFNNL